MLKPSDMILVAVMLSAAAWTYGTKHKAEQKAEEVARLEREVRQESETIKLLEADWSLLNQPYRLQALVDRHGDELKLAPVEPWQVVGPDQLPVRPVSIVPFDGAAEPDRTVTSSIGR